jgi:hypothetical protein
MSLLQDAANYEEQHWRNRLSGWRRQAARDYLGQLGRVVVLILLAILLLDGARRDVLHATASVVAVKGGATLQTASGKHAPAPSFVGQSYSLGDTLATDATGSVTLAFPDGTVIGLGPKNSLQQTQSSAYRNGLRSRWFAVGDGPLQVYNPSDSRIALINPKGGGILGGGSTNNKFFGGSAAANLARYSVKPNALTGLERAVWWPLDTLLGKLGVMGLGTFRGTDSQRRDECQQICLALQKVLPTTSPSTSGLVPLASLGLSSELTELGSRCVSGPYVLIARTGPGFMVQLTARDSQETEFTVTAQGIKTRTKN